MNDIDRLLLVADAYCRATGLSEARVSTLFLNGGSRLVKLRAGGDMGSLTIARAIAAFSADWPASAAWPSDVPRPPADAASEPGIGTGAAALCHGAAAPTGSAA